MGHQVCMIQFGSNLGDTSTPQLWTNARWSLVLTPPLLVCTLQYSTVQCSTVQCNTVQCVHCKGNTSRWRSMERRHKYSEGWFAPEWYCLDIHGWSVADRWPGTSHGTWSHVILYTFLLDTVPGVQAILRQEVNLPWRRWFVSTIQYSAV